MLIAIEVRARRCEQPSPKTKFSEVSAVLRLGGKIAPHWLQVQLEATDQSNALHAKYEEIR